MKKFKIIFSVLVLSLVFSGCEDIQSQKNTETENTEETESLETVNEETNDQSSEIAEDEKESNNEQDKETKEEEVVEIVDDQKETDNNEVLEKIVITKPEDQQLDTSMTDEMQKELNDYSITLVSKSGATYDGFPKEGLKAIAKYSNDESHGWVVRYGENKIGLAQSFYESNTGVFILFDGEGILESEESVIKNDSAEEYKEQAENILKNKIAGEAEIDYAY